MSTIAIITTYNFRRKAAKPNACANGSNRDSKAIKATNNVPNI